VRIVQWTSALTEGVRGKSPPITIRCGFSHGLSKSMSLSATSTQRRPGAVFLGYLDMVRFFLSPYDYLDYLDNLDGGQKMV
jgi:hypothetical protein